MRKKLRIRKKTVVKAQLFFVAFITLLEFLSDKSSF